MSSHRLSNKALKNLKTIVGLQCEVMLATVSGKSEEIVSIMSTIRNALRNSETPNEVIEAVVSDDIVNYLIDLIAADFGEMKLSPAEKSAPTSWVNEMSEPVAGLGSVN